MFHISDLASLLASQTMLTPVCTYYADVVQAYQHCLAFNIAVNVRAMSMAKGALMSSTSSTITP